jgi:hypothetical protein
MLRLFVLRCSSSIMVPVLRSLQMLAWVESSPPVALSLVV